MRNHVFVAHGDLSELSADAIAYSTSPKLNRGGDLHSAFAQNVPGFTAALARLAASGTALHPGDAVWLDLELPGAPGSLGSPAGSRGPRLPRGVIVVIAVGDGADHPEGARRAVRAAIEAAARHLPAPAPGARLLLALPTFLLGQGGGRDGVLQIARAQIESARDTLEGLQDRCAIDVAFVAYTPANYHAFLRARRATLGNATLPGDPETAALLAALRRRECVLFLGSGLSTAAGLGSWDALVRTLEASLEIPARSERRDLEYYLDLAQWYREQSNERGLPPLEDVVREHFGPGARGARPTLAHYLLLALPVRHVITTNYDDLIERTATAVGRAFLTVARQDEVALTGRVDRMCIVKFHGDAAAGGDLVLSRDDYDDFFQRRPAMALLLEGLLLNQTFFFLGYSLRDPNFRQVYHRIAQMLRGARRPAFAADLDGHSDHARRQWREKQLHLLSPPGDSVAVRAESLLRSLDALGEAVAEDPQVFLAADAAADVTGQLLPLRHCLVLAGAEVERLSNNALTADEVPAVARTLKFLAQMGWRPPSGRPLSRIWERLAARLPHGSPERLKLLTQAVAHTDTFGESARLRALLRREDPR